MKKSGKWLYRVLCVLCLLCIAIWFLGRPAAEEHLEPLLKEAGKEQINGTLTWETVELDPLYDIEFSNIELRDRQGKEVFKAPSVKVTWTIAGAVSAWKNGNGVSGMIQDVILQQPEIHISEEKNQTWNIQSILKPQPEETSSHFQGRILMKDGLAKLSLKTAGEYQFQNLEGQFSWQNKDNISAAVSGVFSGAHFDTRISYINEKNFHAEASTDAVDLTAVQPFLSYLPDSVPAVDLRGGHAIVTKASIRQENGSLSYAVYGTVEKAHFSVDQYEITEGNFSFSIADGTAYLNDVKLRVNDQPVSGEMRISWNESPEIQGKIQAEHVDVSKFSQNEAITGIGAGSFNISGSPADFDTLSVSGHVALADGSAYGMPVKSGEAAFSLRKGRLTLSSAEIQTVEGKMQGAGWYDLLSGEFDIKAVADNFTLSPLKDSMGVSGTVSGTINAAGHWNGSSITFSALDGAAEGQNLTYEEYKADALTTDFYGNNDTINVRFLGNGLTYGEIKIDSASGEVSGNKNVWNVSYLNGTMGDGAFSLRGHWNQGEMKFYVQAGDIEVSPLAALAGQDLHGKLFLDGMVSGTLEHPVFNLTASMNDGRFKNADFHELTGELSSDGEWMTIHHAEMTTMTGQHQLSGRIALSGDHELDLKEVSEHTRIENILNLAGIHAPLTGWIQNESTIRGTVNVPEITGRFMAWDGSVAGELYQSVSADYALKEGRALHVSNGLAYIYGGAATLEGNISEQALDLDLALVDVDIERILRQGPAQGRVTFRGHVSGDMDSPVFEGNLISRRISVDGAEIEQVAAGVSYKDKVFQITDGFFRQKDGSFRWSGMANAETGAVNGHLNFYGWSLKEALKFFHLPVSQIKGTMNGGMLLQGTLDNPDVSLNVNLDGGSLGNTVMGAGKFNLSYINGLLSIQECYVPIGNGILAAKGTVQNGGDIQLTAAATQMDISWIPQVLGVSDLMLGGNLTAGITLSGSLSDPAADISVTVTNPRYNEFGFDELSLMGNAQQGVFKMDQLLASKNGYKASAHGTVPVSALTRIPDGRNIPFDVDVDLDRADLNALVFMADAVTSASGPIEGHIKVTGPWNDPAIHGNAIVRNGQMTLKALSEPVNAVNGTLTFSGKQANLTGNAALGGGTISAASQVNWDQMKLSGYEGEAHAHMPNLNSLYYKGRLDADMTLSESRGLPKITGAVNVQDAVVDIPLSLESGGSGPDVLLDVGIALGDNVRLYNSLLYDLAIRGNIRAMGLLSRPATSGRVVVEKGVIKYLSNEFTVTEGSAVWGGIPDSFLPVVNVKADTAVGHYNIGMELQGPPGNFRFNLHSEPALNDSQIMTLLTLRQAPGSAEEDHAAGALFNAGLSMIFSGGVQDLIRNTFGLDMISVTSSLTDYYSSDSSINNNDNYYIKIGKYLFNDFMLTATMGVNNEDQSYGFRYELKSRVGLAAWYNNDHDSYVGADYQFQF